MVKVKTLFVALIMTVVVSGSVFAQENASKVDGTPGMQFTISENTDSAQGGAGATYTVWRGSEPY